MPGQSPRGFSHVDEQDDASFYIGMLEAQDRAPEVMRVRAKALELMEPRPGMRILDAGCGIGTALIEIAPHVEPGGSLVGIDVSERMLEVARERARSSPAAIDVMRGDITALQFDDASFDAARAERVLQHVDEPSRALAELVRVVRPGGRVVVADTDWDSFAMDLPDHELVLKLRAAFVDRFKSATVGRRLYGMFRRAGLQDVRIEGLPVVVTEETIGGTDVRPGEIAIRAAVEEGKLTPREGDRAFELMASAIEENAYLVSFTMYVACGTVG